MNTLLATNPAAARLDLLRQSGVLLMDPRAGAAFFGIMGGVSSEAMGNGVTVIKIRGATGHNPDLLEQIMGTVSAEDIVAAITDAANDDSVPAVLLDVDSPGGSIAGISDLVDAVEKCKAKKPVYAIAHDYCTSAAFWWAAAASELLATPTATLGSISAAVRLVNDAGILRKMGADVVEITGEPDKPFGDMTESKVEAVRRGIGETTAMFAESVAVARGLSVEDVRALRGASISAARAFEHGLIDGVISYADCLRTLASMTPADFTDTPAATGAAASPDNLAATTRAADSGRKGNSAMSILRKITGQANGTPKAEDEKKDDKTDTVPMSASQLRAMYPAAVKEIEDGVKAEMAPKEDEPKEETTSASANAAGQTVGQAADFAGSIKPAAISELEVAFPDQPQFVLSCAKAGMSLAQARMVAGQMAALRNETQAARTIAADASRGQSPVSGSPTNGANSGETKAKTKAEQFFALRDSIRTEKKVTLAVATSTAINQNPTLHAEYLAEIRRW